MPKPVLQAMVLADHVYQDRLTGKFVIAGTFGTVILRSAQAAAALAAPRQEGERVKIREVSQAGSPYLYLALTEVHGNLPLHLRYMDLSDSSLLFEAEMVLTANDPVGTAEYCIPLPALPTHKTGVFSLDLLYNEELLGSWRIVIAQPPPADPSQENEQ